MIDFNFNIKENSSVYCINCNKLLANSNNTYLGTFSIFKCFDCGICFHKNNFIAYNSDETIFCITYYKDGIFITNKNTGKIDCIKKFI